MLGGTAGNQLEVSGQQFEDKPFVHKSAL